MPIDQDKQILTEIDKKQANELTERQKKALPHLVASKTLKDACKRAGISRAVYYKWLKQSAFKKALKVQRDALVEEALEILRGNVNEAVVVLIDLLNNTDSESLKRLVCNDIIGYTMKAKELEDLETRIVALEKKLSDKGSK